MRNGSQQHAYTIMRTGARTACGWVQGAVHIRSATRSKRRGALATATATEMRSAAKGERAFCPSHRAHKTSPRWIRTQGCGPTAGWANDLDQHGYGKPTVHGRDTNYRLESGNTREPSAEGGVTSDGPRPKFRSARSTRDTTALRAPCTCPFCGMAEHGVWFCIVALP